MYAFQDESDQSDESEECSGRLNPDECSGHLDHDERCQQLIKLMDSVGINPRALALWITQGFSWQEFLGLLDQWDQVNELELSEFDDESPLDMLLPVDCSLEDQLAAEELVKQGFTIEEGIGLLGMRQHIMENPEMCEHPNMQFGRWLYQHGYLSRDMR